MKERSPLQNVVQTILARDLEQTPQNGNQSLVTAPPDKSSALSTVLGTKVNVHMRLSTKEC